MEMIFLSFSRTSFENSSEDHRSGEDTNDRQSFTETHEIPADKCPVCLMIFPANMTPAERTRHGQEHYLDEP